MPKITILGVGIDATNTSQQIEELNNNEKFHKGTKALKNGGVICFDDFERKSSKIDLNDLFGFITNLTENFNTKTVIITNQEVFQHHDQKVFNTVKEKSVNKFILYNPTIEELFDVIYKNDKYKILDQYKAKILEAIQLSEEKNARIYIQVLNNCLEYAEKVKDVNERAIYLLSLTTILFVKHNFIFKMEQYGESYGLLPTAIEQIPDKVLRPLLIRLKNYFKTLPIKAELINVLKERVSSTYKITDSKNSSSSTVQAPTNLLDENLKYISANESLLYTIYKYIIYHNCFQEKESMLLEKINNFVESGILLEE